MQPAITHDQYADYVVLGLKRPWFIIDKGCDWLYGACRNAYRAAKFLRLVDETRQRYDVVFERDGFMILRRKDFKPRLSISRFVARRVRRAHRSMLRGAHGAPY